MPLALVASLKRVRHLLPIVVPLLLILVLASVDKAQGVRLALRAWREPAHLGITALNLLLALLAVYGAVRVLRIALAVYLGAAHARSAAKFLAILFYALVGALTLNAAGFNLSGFFVGGALTGVILGLAAQAALSNVVAGVVILFARPYRPGEHVQTVLDSTPYSGVVADIGLVYTTLRSGQDLIRVPNSTMVAAVIVLPPESLIVLPPEG